MRNEETRIFIYICEYMMYQLTVARYIEGGEGIVLRKFNNGV